MLLEEVAEAFRRAGARPLIYYGPRYDYREIPIAVASRTVSQRDLLELVHMAADSYLPAILNLKPRPNSGDDRHSVLLVGHTTVAPGDPLTEALPAKLHKDDPETDDYFWPLTTTRWIRDLIVHDDAKAPFLRIPVDTSQRDPESLAVDERRTIARDLESVIIPFPRAVHFDPRYVTKHVHQLLIDTFDEEDKPPLSSAAPRDLPTPRLDQLVAAAATGKDKGRNDLVTGVYLDHGERFRQGMCAAIAGRPDADRELRLLKSLILPSYVWVASVMVRSECDRLPDSDRGLGGTLGAQIHGYILIDATRHQFSERVALLVRLGEFCQYLHPDEGITAEEWMPFPPRRQPGTLGHDATAEHA